MENPFIAGNYIQKTADFYNRTELIQQLLRPNSSAFFLHGIRRMGKTSTLRHIERLLINSDKIMPAYVSIQGSQTAELMGKDLSRAIIRCCNKLNIGRFDSKEDLDLIAVIERWLDFSEKIEYECFLLLDEAEELLNLPDAYLEKLRKTLLDQYDNLNVIITATSRLRELLNRKSNTSTFLYGFIHAQIGPLSDQEVKDLILQTQKPNGQVTVSPKTLEAIVKYCGGHPYLIQKLCYELFEDGSLRDITPKDLILDKFLIDIFKVDFEGIGPDEQKVLTHLHWEQGQTLVALAKQTQISTHELPSYLRELENLGFAIEENGTYRLRNYFFAQWIEAKQSASSIPKIEVDCLTGLKIEASSFIYTTGNDGLEYSCNTTGTVKIAYSAYKELSKIEYKKERLMLAGICRHAYENGKTPPYITLDSIRFIIETHDVPADFQAKRIKLLEYLLFKGGREHIYSNLGYDFDFPLVYGDIDEFRRVLISLEGDGYITIKAKHKDGCNGVLPSKKGIEFVANSNTVGQKDEPPASHKVIKIFLASSSELSDDRREFERFIYQQTKYTLPNKAVFLELVQWEDFLDTISLTRLQDEYNKALMACDMAVCLFYTKVGPYTAEEFDVALGQFRETGKPSIITYFKEKPLKPSEFLDFESVLNFKKKLKEIGHYYTTYESIGDLKHHFGEQLKKLYDI